VVIPVLLLLVSLAATGWSVRLIRRSGNAPGRTAFGLALLGNCWWVATTMAQILSPSVEGKILASQMAWLGNTSAPFYWCVSIYAYASGRSRESPAVLVAIAVFAVAVMMAALTNEYHHGIYTHYGFVEESYGTKVVYHHGALFWALIGFNYLALISGVSVSLLAARRGSTLHRRQFTGLLVAVALPWVFNALTISTGFTIYGVDPEPFGFIATGLILGFVFGRERLFAVAPIAGGVLFEAIPDPVIAIDGSGRVLELNPAARALPEMAKEPVGEFLAGPIELVTCLGAASPREDTFEITVASNRRSYEVIRRGLVGRSDGGSLVVLRDVTESLAVREELIAKSAELQKRLDENVELQRQLRHQADHDHLTGLLNRGHAHRVLPDLLAADRAAGRRAALVLLDLDHFKVVNDLHGHPVGDAVLKTFATVLGEGAGPGGYAFRHGGEEFLVYLPGAGAEEALRRCAEWRARLRRVEIAAAPELTIAFSAGVAVMPNAGREMDELVRAADVALYRAKVSGRDRVVVWGEHTRPLFGDDGTTPRLDLSGAA
jgi:diguanylate cyclase (GGDEF)-like protein